MKEELQILYVDNHLLAVNKPPGILTQPSGTDNVSIEEYAKLWIKQEYQKPGNVYLHAIHRLDKAASGIVLFARTSKALSRLQEQSRNHEFHKVYQALVFPAPTPQKGTLEHWLVHDDHLALVVDPKIDPHAKLCRLSYEIVESSRAWCKVRVHLHTGRYHQIRAQFSAIGCPIIGDSKYGSSVPYAEGIALHHGELTFRHPVSHEVICLTAPDRFRW